jgi:hypothetical protein
MARQTSAHLGLVPWSAVGGGEADKRHMTDEVKQGRAVLDKLLQLDAAYAAPIRPNQSSAKRINHHRIFLLLYHYTTVRWLEFAETSNLPAILNQVLVEFYCRYRDYVFEPVVENAVCPVPHWEAYFKQADSYCRRPGQLSGLKLLEYGAYAHTRYDLAEAIAAAVSVGHSAGLSKAEQEIIGPRSAHIFIRAARDFLENYERVLPEIVPSFGRASFWFYVHSNTQWWLPRFQRWREGAWADAMMLRETGRSKLTETEIRRRMGESPVSA